MMPELSVEADPLSVPLIRQRLCAYTVGRRLLLYDAVPSTNAVLRELARAGAQEGTVVLADSQTAGRGRGGKPWFSPPGVNLYVSTLLRPSARLEAVSALPFTASLALADAIRELGLPVAIKWPNDVLVRRKKVAGVLAEVATAGGGVDSLVLGVGVNVNVERAALAAALGPAAQFATSLREALGGPVDRNALAAGYLSFLDEWLVIYRTQGPRAVLRAWRDLDIVTGCRVEIREGATRLDGRARGVDDEGRLEVEDAHGRIHQIVSGEVRLVE